MSKTSPTQRTLAYLRKCGCDAAITEKWNPHAKVRQDLFGFVDILYLPVTYDGPMVAVQTTSGSNHAARRTKILGCPVAKRWLECGSRIEIWSWSKKKVKRGGKAVRWEHRIERITLTDFEER